MYFDASELYVELLSGLVQSDALVQSFKALHKQSMWLNQTEDEMCLKNDKKWWNLKYNTSIGISNVISMNFFCH